MSSSSSSSFFSKVGAVASAAAAGAKQAAVAAATAVQNTYNDMKAAPSVVLCKTCNIDVAVSPEVWKWNCTANHSNIWDAPTCQTAECKAVRPKDLPNPTVSCGKCNAVIQVPSSNFTRHLKEGGHKTAEFVKTSAAQTKAYIEHQAASPDTFHCSHCDALLAVPTGPWTCQSCANTNEEPAKTCVKCSQKKTEQKAICGVCNQSTAIPTSNFADSFSHNVREASQSSKKLYYDVSGKPYTTCPQCKAHIEVKAPPAVNAAAAAVQPPSGEGNNSDPVVAEGAGSNSKQVECPKCKNKFDRVAVAPAPAK